MARKIAPDAQEAIAVARFIRMSPTKARQVVDLIRGRHVDDARRVLKFSNRSAAGPVAKVLDSAVANAEHNGNLPSDELLVARAWVDEGPTLRRYRPRALGRATRIRKRTCHIAIVVGRAEPEPRPPRRRTGASTEETGGSAPESARARTTSKTTAKKTTAKKTAAKKTTAKKTTARKPDGNTTKNEGES